RGSPGGLAGRGIRARLRRSGRRGRRAAVRSLLPGTRGGGRRMRLPLASQHTRKGTAMNKRFFLAWLVVFIAWFVGSFIVHGVLLHNDYAALPNLFRKEAESQNFFPLMILAHLIMSGAFVWIYARGVEAKPEVGQGVRYGIAVICLMTLPIYLSYYAAQPR